MHEGIDVNRVVKDGLSITGEPAMHVAKAKGKGGKATPESIVKNIKG